MMDARILTAAAIIQLIGSIDGAGPMAIRNRLATRMCASFEEFLESKEPSGKVKLPAGSNEPYCWQLGCAAGGNCDPPKWELRSCTKAKEKGKKKEAVGTRTLKGGSKQKARLVGASDALPHSSPYVINIFNYEQTKIYGHGFLFDRYTVILDNFPLLYNLSDTSRLHQFRVIAGAHNRWEPEVEREMRQICDYTVHPKQTASPRTNSYGIIHLYDPLTFNTAVKEAKFRSYDHAKDPESLQCKFASWGADESGAWTRILQEKSIKLELSSKLCEPTETEFCAEKGLCFQDYGSPLMCPYQSRPWVFGMGSFNGRPNDPSCMGSTTGYSSFSDMRKAELQTWIEEDIESKRSKCRTQYDFEY